jgi:hypothetical protein
MGQKHDELPEFAVNIMSRKPAGEENSRFKGLIGIEYDRYVLAAKLQNSEHRQTTR